MRSQMSPVVVCAILLVLAGTAPAATDAQRCEAAKLRAAAKYGACRLVAEKTAVLHSTMPDYTKCDVKYSTAWPTAESKYGVSCPTTGDLAPVQTDLTTFASCMAAKLNGDSVGNCFRQLPATGQTGSSVANDDGALETGGTLQYVDNADGTITDLNTGLMWEKKGKLDAVVDAANLNDADNCYQWNGSCALGGSPCGVDTDCAGGANGPCNAEDCLTPFPNGWTIFKWAAALNAASFAGHSDWRVPNYKELISIIDLGQGYPATAIAPAFNTASCGTSCADITSAACSCTQNYCYWSSSTAPTSASEAFDGFFYAGCGLAYPKTQKLYVRAVRSGS